MIILTRMSIIKKLKFIQTGPVQGYTLSSIKKTFTKTKFDEFQKWMFGETYGYYKGKPLIYKHHLEMFLNGKPSPLF